MTSIGGWGGEHAAQPEPERVCVDVPVASAVQIAETFEKDGVLVFWIDRKHDKQGSVSFGRSEPDRQMMASVDESFRLFLQSQQPADATGQATELMAAHVNKLLMAASAAMMHLERSPTMSNLRIREQLRKAITFPED